MYFVYYPEFSSLGKEVEFFLCFELHKQNLFHLHCIGVEAEILEMDITQPQIIGKARNFKIMARSLTKYEKNFHQ